MKAWILLILVGATVSACGTYHPQSKLHMHFHEPLSTRAAFDFQCPEADLSFSSLGNMTQGVTGCGQRGVYVRSDYKWVLNSVETMATSTPKDPMPVAPPESASAPAGPTDEQVRKDVNCFEGDINYAGGLGTTDGEVILRPVEACGAVHQYIKTNGVWVLQPTKTETNK